MAAKTRNSTKCHILEEFFEISANQLPKICEVLSDVLFTENIIKASKINKNEVIGKAVNITADKIKNKKHLVESFYSYCEPYKELKL